MVCIGALFAGLYQSLPMPGVGRPRGVARHRWVLRQKSGRCDGFPYLDGCAQVKRTILN